MSRLPQHKMQHYVNRPDGELDLHGLTRAEALPELEAFLDHAESLNWAKVRVITGQGRNSETGEAVLRDWLEAYLDRNGYAHVRAGKGNGGNGAVHVSLKRVF